MKNLQYDSSYAEPVNKPARTVLSINYIDKAFESAHESSDVQSTNALA